MRSTLQHNGWRDPTDAPAVGMGPVMWRGQDQGSWPAGSSGGPPAGGEVSRPPNGGGTTDPVPDDASLVERSKVDADAFGVLYDRYCDRIYRYVFRRLRNHEAAEDVTAEIFLKVL